VGVHLSLPATQHRFVEVSLLLIAKYAIAPGTHGEEVMVGVPEKLVDLMVG
jgi:hypothetical protein